MIIKPIFKRKLYAEMLNWKSTRKGTTALLIEGPRRVGKSTLDEFCRKFSSRILEKYIIYTKDMRMDHDISCIPIYLTMFL